MDIKELSGNIKNKDIYLFGIDPHVDDFAKKYSAIIKIKGVLTDHKDEMKLQKYKGYGLETLWLEDQKLGENTFIILCAGIEFKSRRLRLLYKGLREYVDFISEKLIETLLYDKKPVVIMGTSVLKQVASALSNDAGLCGKYSFSYFCDTNIREPYADMSAELSHVAKGGYAYISSSCEKDRYIFKSINPALLPKDCLKIKIPDCGFKGYHPQLSYGREHFSKYFLRGYERLGMEYETLAFARTDCYLEKLCEEDSDDSSILQKVMDPDFISADIIEENWTKEIDRLKTFDDKSNICLTDYFIKNSNGILCKSQDELNSDIISYIAGETVVLLGEKKADQYTFSENSLGTEIELYPSVQRFFGAEKELDEKKYRIVTFTKEMELSLEDYFKYHIDYIKKSMKLKNLTYMNEVE